MPNNLESYYRELDIEPNSSLEDVKRAYREMVKVWHPDRFTHDPHLQAKAQEKLKRINAAHDFLQDFFLSTSPIQTESSPPPHKKPSQSHDWFELGASYYLGRGVQKDFAIAATWFKKAAEAGHTPSQKTLGTMYCNGEGVPKDLAAGMQWMQKAAEQNDAQAQLYLAQLYNEDGITNVLLKSLNNSIGWKFGDAKIEAYKWANLAVTYGVPEGLDIMSHVSVAMSRNLALPRFGGQMVCERVS